MDGREFRRRQRLSSTMAFIPVVVVSGLPNLAAATRGMATRAELKKPVGWRCYFGQWAHTAAGTEDAPAIPADLEVLVTPPRPGAAADPP
jgi:hypothetical protein